MFLTLLEDEQTAWHCGWKMALAEQVLWAPEAVMAWAPKPAPPPFAAAARAAAAVATGQEAAVAASFCVAVAHAAVAEIEALSAKLSAGAHGLTP